VLELSQLVKALESELGVSAAAAMPMMMPGGGAGGGAAAAAPVEEKTDFNVSLVSFPADKKINIIKAVREVTSLGLKEAKDLVEAVPKVLKEGVNKDEAEAIRKKFDEVGAKVEIK
jgi:large subunit ribosomal protein L7/L12